MVLNLQQDSSPRGCLPASSGSLGALESCSIRPYLRRGDPAPIPQGIHCSGWRRKGEGNGGGEERGGRVLRGPSERVGHRDTQSRSRVEHRSPRMSHQRGPGAWRQWWIAEWEVKIRQQSRGVCRYPGDLGHRDRQRSMQEPSNQLPAYCHSAPPPSSRRALSERRSWEDHLRARKASATAKASRRERKEAGPL